MGTLDARHISENALPVIDISGLKSADKSVRQAVGDEIRSACLDLGFMYVVGHGVSSEMRAAVFEESAAFFALPEAGKLALDMRNSIGNAGYEPLRAQTLEAGGPPDLKEGFYIGEELSADHPRVVAGGFNLGPNQWPEGMPGFRKVMSSYYDEMLDLGRLLMRGIALSSRAFGESSPSALPAATGKCPPRRKRLRRPYRFRRHHHADAGRQWRVAGDGRRRRMDSCAADG